MSKRITRRRRRGDRVEESRKLRSHSADRRCERSTASSLWGKFTCETDRASVRTTGAVNHLINIVHSSNKSLVYEASRALAHICGAPHLARTLNDMHVTEAVVNLIQVSIRINSDMNYFV
jgi:hypothetical protein